MLVATAVARGFIWILFWGFCCAVCVVDAWCVGPRLWVRALRVSVCFIFFVFSFVCSRGVGIGFWVILGWMLIGVLGELWVWCVSGVFLGTLLVVFGFFVFRVLLGLQDVFFNFFVFLFFPGVVGFFLFFFFSYLFFYKTLLSWRPLIAGVVP